MIAQNDADDWLNAAALARDCLYASAHKAGNLTDELRQHP